MISPHSSFTGKKSSYDANAVFKTSQFQFYLEKQSFFKIVSRTPLFEMICKDGRSSPAFLALVEVSSLDNILRMFRLCFVYHVAECLGNFVSPNDWIRIFNLKENCIYNDYDEIVLGRDDAELFFLNQETHHCNITLVLYREGHRTPAVLEISLKTKQIAFQYLPEWTKTFNYTTTTVLTALPNRLWSKPLPGSFLNSSDILFTDLVYLQERALVNFFACVVEVCLAPRFLTLPNVGQVVVMNVTVVDPSLARTYRVALLSNNSFRLSVMFIAMKPEQLPCITCGDVIRVYQGGFYVTQDMKTKAIYLNCRTDPAMTHLAVWSINKLASVENTCEMPPSLDDACPIWTSVPTPLRTEDHSTCLSINAIPNSPAHYWNQVRHLAQWAAESLYFLNCFTNEYTTSLLQTAETTTKKHCDLFVYILCNVVESTQRLREQRSYNNQIKSSCFQPFHFQSHFVPTFHSFTNEKTSWGSNRYNSSNVSSICFHVYDGNETSHLPSFHRSVLLNLVNISLPHCLYLTEHIEKGDWLLLKNVCFLQLIPATFDHDASSLDIYEFDASRCRSVKLPFFSKEIQKTNLNS